MKQSSSNRKAQSNGNNNGSQQKSNPPGLLEKFFTDQLKDIYYVEQKLLKALPKMKDAATTEELEEAFELHLKQTEKHATRLEKVFSIINMKPEAKKCEAIEGLVKEAEEIISETKPDTMTRDAALIIAAQKIEHYEIATYGGLVQLALTIGLSRAAQILDKTLLEEEETDHSLTFIAEQFINIEAEEEGPYSWESKTRNSSTSMISSV